MFVLTGMVLTLQRLGSAPVPPAYPALLAVKVALGVWMFTLARKVGAAPAASPSWATTELKMAGAGVAIYALAIVLRTIYEDSIRP